MAQVSFSRHARRRMQLYEISQDTVIDILPLMDVVGRHTATRHSPGHKFPIKVVYEVQSEETIVITAYPVKKAKQ
jgi:hypothetical protein